MINDFRGDNAFLSNFYPAVIEFLGVMYPTTEHAYQAAKTLNPAEREIILKQTTPGKAKRAGQKVTIRPEWEDVKLNIMYGLVRQKFTNDVKLKNKLLATENKKLVEGNTWGDTFWGVDTRIDQGFNYLGKILMKVRGELNDTDHW